MIVRREGFGTESRRAALARRLEEVAGIRRGTYTRMDIHRRREETRFVRIDQHPHGQDAA